MRNSVSASKNIFKSLNLSLFADLEEIYALKKNDLNAHGVEAGIKIIAGTARNMGVEVEM